jgi:hypothetical protein
VACDIGQGCFRKILEIVHQVLEEHFFQILKKFVWASEHQIFCIYKSAFNNTVFNKKYKLYLLLKTVEKVPKKQVFLRISYDSHLNSKNK